MRTARQGSPRAPRRAYPKTERSRRRAADGEGRSPRSTGCRRGSTRRCCPRRTWGADPARLWRTRERYPALDAAGIRCRGPYHLRHTFATEALAAGVSIFVLARLMGCSLQMIERHNEHLARDSEQAARDLLDARSAS